MLINETKTIELSTCNIIEIMFVKNKCVYKAKCLKEVQIRLSNKHITHRKRIKTKRIGTEMYLSTSYDTIVYVRLR